MGTAKACPESCVQAKYGGIYETAERSGTVPTAPQTWDTGLGTCNALLPALLLNRSDTPVAELYNPSNCPQPTHLE